MRRKIIESEEKRLLVEEIVRLTNEVRDNPKVVVVENVPRMLTKENGLYISKLLEGLPEYEAEVKIICDYKVGGYTMRERCIVILSRIGKITLPDIEVLPIKTVKDALIQVDSTWYNYNDYAYNHPLFTPNNKIYSDSTVSKFIREISVEDSVSFQNEWNAIKKKTDRIYISYDSTNKNCQAGEIDLAEFGHAKDDKELPIINYSISYVDHL